MTRTSIRFLAVIALAVGFGSHLILAFLDDRSAYPVPVSSVTAMLLMVVAIVLWRLGIAVKRLVAREETRMDILAAARVAMFAKACSLGGAGLIGYFTAQTLVGVRNFASPQYFEHTWVSAVTVLACLGLVVVALIVESWCVISSDEDDPKGGAKTPRVA